MLKIKPRGTTGELLHVPAYDQRYYYTWYAFKKDLESLCGYPVLNTLWLQVKPQIPLPWDKSNILSTLLKLKQN